MRMLWDIIGELSNIRDTVFLDMFCMNSVEVIVAVKKMKIAENLAKFGLIMSTFHGIFMTVPIPNEYRST